MHLPADPWGNPAEPTPRYGRASVPVPPALRDPTAELPVFERAVPAPRPVRVSWEKVKNPSRRNLSDGWGLTAAGVIMIVTGWAVWAAASRGTGTSVWPGFLLALVLGTILFVITRATGYVVLERVMGRSRPHARWSHFVAGLFLTLVGVWYLVNTKLQLAGGDWLQDAWEWLKDLGPGG